MFFKKILRNKDASHFLELLINTKWSFLGTFFSKLSLFLTWIFIARFLGSELFGQFGIIRSTVLMFTSFAGFSLGLTANKFISEFSNNTEKIKNIVSLSLIVGLLSGLTIGVLFYFSSNWLAVNTLNEPKLSSLLSIASFILFFSSLNGALIGILQGFHEFKLIAKINFIQTLICCPLMLFATFFYSLKGSIISFVIFHFILFILCFFFVISIIKKENIRLSFNSAFKEIGLIFNYMLPATLGGLLVVPVKWYVNSLLVLNSGFKEMGLFEAALIFHSMFLTLSETLSAPFISSMSKHKNSNSNILSINILSTWFLGVVVCLPLLFFPNLFLNIFGRNYNDPNFKYIFSIVILYTIIIMFRKGVTRIIAVYNYQWLGFFDNLIWALTLIFVYMNFSNQNALNLALSFLIAYTINSLIFLPIYCYKNLIPKNILISYNSILVWLFIIISTFLGLIVSSFKIKLSLLLIVLFILAIIFKSIFEKNQKILNEK